jgi:hypothetical protein
MIPKLTEEPLKVALPCTVPEEKMLLDTMLLPSNVAFPETIPKSNAKSENVADPLTVPKFDEFCVKDASPLMVPSRMLSPEKTADCETVAFIPN